jgi:hypothetical protein
MTPQGVIAGDPPLTLFGSFLTIIGS